MKKVFFGGSRLLSSLSSEVRHRLEGIIKNKFFVLVGDANGADKAAQKFFADNGYENVIVYCMNGVCRNNIGKWEVEAIEATRQAKDFKYFALKDEQMCQAADYGFVLWDGKSKGTLNNILNLLEQQKQVLVYFSPQKELNTLKKKADLKTLLEQCDSESRDYFEKKIKLSQRVESSDKFQQQLI